MEMLGESCLSLLGEPAQFLTNAALAPPPQSSGAACGPTRAFWEHWALSWVPFSPATISHASFSPQTQKPLQGMRGSKGHSHRVASTCDGCNGKALANTWLKSAVWL